MKIQNRKTKAKKMKVVTIEKTNWQRKRKKKS